MNTVISLVISVGLLAGVASWLFLFVGSIVIWAAFVAWACFFHSGGNQEAFISTIVCNAFGVVCAWIAALIILIVPLGNVLGMPLWAAIVVALTVGAYVMASKLALLASIPGTTYGYACTFAYLLQTPEKLTVEALTQFTFDNALITVIVSMVIGACFGYLSGRMATLLAKPA